MANEIKKIDVVGEDILAKLAALLSGNGGFGNQNSPLMDKLDKVLGKQLKEQEDNEGVLKNAKLQGAQAMQQRADNEHAKQDWCPHLKPNNQSAISGQRDHSNNYLYICQYCGKNWTGRELPAVLAPPSIFIGGPQIS